MTEQAEEGQADTGPAAPVLLRGLTIVPTRARYDDFDLVLDEASYRDSRSARDRDRLRKEHRERLGWIFHRIWSTNWFTGPAAEAARVEQADREAVARAEPGRAGRPGRGTRRRARARRGAQRRPAPDVPASDGPLPPGPGQAIAVREPASPQHRLPPG